MIQAAINGNRYEDHVPSTTEAIVFSSIEAVKAGASSIHFHARNENGKETLKGVWIDEQISSLKTHLKEISIGVSTGAWIEPDLSQRLEQIRSWKILPDFVSINYDEDGFEDITEAVSEKGIQIEVGLSNITAAQNFIRSNREANYLRILIEPQEKILEDALETIQNIEKLLQQSKIDTPVLLHGVNETCWSILKLAFKKGYATRVGFEDTLTLPSGVMAKSNAELILEAVKVKSTFH